MNLNCNMASNDISKFQHVFTWEIKNFLMNECSEDKELRSPDFKAVNIHEDAVWHINFYPRGRKNDFRDDYASCFLVRCDDNRKFGEIYCEYSLEIIATNGEAAYSMTDKCKFINWFSSGFQNFVDMKLINNSIISLPDDTLTLRCSMKGKATREPKVSRNFAITKIGFDRTTSIWNIANVLDPSTTKTISFEIGEADMYQVSFSLPQECSEIHIHRLTKTRPVTKIHLKVSVVDKYGVESESTQCEQLFKGGNCLWTNPFILTRRELSIKYRKYIINNSLFLKCVFTVSNGTQFRSMTEYQYSPPVCENAPHDVDTLAALIEDLKSMYANPKFADVTLKFGGQVIKAHKAILSSQSEWFAAKFENSDLTEMSLNSMEPNLLNMFLEYMYTGSIEKLDSDSAYHLMSVADDYKMKSFREYCYEYCSAGIKE